jgi:hypothetical protein
MIAVGTAGDRYDLERPRAVSAVCVVGFVMTGISALGILASVVTASKAGGMLATVIMGALFVAAEISYRIGMWRMQAWGVHACRAWLLPCLVLVGFSPLQFIVSVTTLFVGYRFIDNMH